MQLLVYEHVSGGGFAGELIPPSVLSEGFSMLRTLVADFEAAGHNVTTTLDSRIARLNPPINANCVVPVFSSREAQVKIQKIAEQVDAVYLIAPETNGVLRSLVALFEHTDVTSLNCSASAIEAVSDKAGFYTFMRKHGLPLPETLMFGVDDDVKEIKKAVQDSLDFPLIFKPSNTVSCCGLSVARNENQVVAAVDKIKKESSSNQFLAQELIKGAAASVCLLSTGENTVPVSLNRQDVTIEGPEACSSYLGGSVPFDHLFQAEAFEVAEKIVKSFPGLRGYLGVDFVLTKDKAVALEVNARLTTSYVGLRSVANFNPAQAIVNAALKNKLPADTDSCGFACFSKVEASNPQVSALQKTYGMNEVVSPPFPVSENSVASAVIATHGATLTEAESRLREAKKRVLNTISRGK